MNPLTIGTNAFPGARMEWTSGGYVIEGAGTSRCLCSRAHFSTSSCREFFRWRDNVNGHLSIERCRAGRANLPGDAPEATLSDDSKGHLRCVAFIALRGRAPRASSGR